MPDSEERPSEEDVQHRQVRRDSDKLMTEIGRLKSLEVDKRSKPYSTPEFHALAEDVEHQAERVFRAAKQEKQDGDDVPRLDASTEDVSPGD